jgi:tetratricopeptide (TPR) repeat protein
MAQRGYAPAAARVAYIVFLVLAGCTSEPSGGCPLPDLNHKRLRDVECQFNLGQVAYRNKDYKQAVKHWEWTANHAPQNIPEGMIVAAAYGTLGYLNYNGLGVSEDRQRSLELYKKAVQHGDLESRAHLGFAYSDKANHFYDLVSAYAWYKSVENFYRPMLDEEISTAVLEDAKKAVFKLRTLLTAAELKKAEDMSWVVR